MTTPKVKMYVLKDGADGYSRPGAEGDRGCVGCGEVAKDKDVLLVDARGRYWHDHCLAEFAAEIERKGETRLKKGGDLLRDRAIAGGGQVVHTPALPIARVRFTTPRSQTYATLCRFDHDGTDAPYGKRTMLLMMWESVKIDQDVLAWVRLLVVDVRLRQGDRFTLFEGSHPVATGEIVKTAHAQEDEERT